MLKRLMIGTVLGLIAFTFVFVVGASATPPGGSPPGQDPCSHGATGKECKPDPQPDKGKDCEKHGNNGGVNEDHCKGEDPPPPCTVNCPPPPCTVNCEPPPPPCKVNCTPPPPVNPPIVLPPPVKPPVVVNCPVGTTKISSDPVVCLKTVTKTVYKTKIVKKIVRVTKVKTVVKWKYKTIIKKKKCGCPPGTVLYKGHCAVMGAG